MDEQVSLLTSAYLPRDDRVPAHELGQIEMMRVLDCHVAVILILLDILLAILLVVGSRLHRS